MPMPMARMHEGRRVPTEGSTLHRGRRYDARVALLMLGRGPARRQRTVALAHVAPGERVLEVGCGSRGFILGGVGA